MRSDPTGSQLTVETHRDSTSAYETKQNNRHIDGQSVLQIGGTWTAVFVTNHRWHRFATVSPKAYSGPTQVRSTEDRQEQQGKSGEQANRV